MRHHTPFSLLPILFCIPLLLTDCEFISFLFYLYFFFYKNGRWETEKGNDEIGKWETGNGMGEERRAGKMSPMVPETDRRIHDLRVTKILRYTCAWLNGHERSSCT